MKFNQIRVGLIHSLIGKNDGVSIVIDQTVNAMVHYMGIGLGNIFFLAAHSSPRFNAKTDDIFWHKNPAHKTIIKNFQKDPAPQCLEKTIQEKGLEAKRVIKEFVEKNDIDLIIAHNTSHPYNFITAIGLGLYMEELRGQGIIWPKLMVWWHDSYFERKIFENPSPVIRKYLKYLPGTSYVDSIVFINREQIDLGHKVFNLYYKGDLEKYFKDRTTVIPNTTEMTWSWKDKAWNMAKIVAPPLDNYNNSFLKDAVILAALQKRKMGLNDAVILLQHTRVVPRKKIELAIDLAFKLEKRYAKEGLKKAPVVLVSGHSGDEQNKYKEFLHDYYRESLEKNPGSNVILIFGENIILSHRDIIVDKKFYKFEEIPALVASLGGIGTYFSEVEGFGNNLLEMMSNAVPVVINKYEVYKTEIEHLGFYLPAIEDGILTDDLVEKAYLLLTDIYYRNHIVKHNLTVLEDKLDHRIIAEKIEPLINNMFTKILHY